MAAAGGCGAAQDDGPAPASGPNQAAAAAPDPVAEAEQDYRDAMKDVENELAAPGDGSYTIVPNGMMGEMWPGQWETEDPGPAGPCMWTLLSPRGELIDNGAVRDGEPGAVVTITEVGSVFHSFDCADWYRVKGS
ncbi:MAG: hypothetical protein H0U62_05020 [Actinobacteria bacterium]|jgi:hypothetical protein|nr:hypothetical protein [Actinomycetota bacterium]